MIKTVITVFILFCLILTGLQVAVSAAEAILEPLTAGLKAPVEGAIFQDELFFNEADGIIKSLSMKIIPTEKQRMKVYSTYTRLRNMSISPDNYDIANTTLAFLYYTAKGGEAYEDYLDEKRSVTDVTGGSELYNLADIYYQTASEQWALIANRYPDVTLYSLPEKKEPYLEKKSETGTILEGLKYPLSVLQVTPNNSKPYQDEKIRTTIQRWIEDNIDTIPEVKDLTEQSPGNYFITSDGPRWAKSTYMDLSKKNVNPDFYDTANYINGFLYFISLAREYYDQYLDERTSIFLTSDGREPYELSKIYYDQAGVALSKFKDQVPEINNSTTLPAFPEINEISMDRKLSQGSLGMITEEDNSESEDTTYTKPTWFF